MEHSPGLVLPSCVSWAIISWGPLWLPGNNPGEEIALDMINYISGLWFSHRLSNPPPPPHPNVFYKGRLGYIIQLLNLDVAKWTVSQL